MDKIDINLLRLIRLEGTSTKAALCRITGKSRMFIWRRVDKGKAEGLIREIHNRFDKRRQLLMLTRLGIERSKTSPFSVT